MKKVLVLVDCKYAQNKPWLPPLSFEMGHSVEIPDYMAESMIKNSDGILDDSNDVEPELPKMIEHEHASISIESKEKPKKRKRS